MSANFRSGVMTCVYVVGGILSASSVTKLVVSEYKDIKRISRGEMCECGSTKCNAATQPRDEKKSDKQ